MVSSVRLFHILLTCFAPIHCWSDEAYKIVSEAKAWTVPMTQADDKPLERPVMNCRRECDSGGLAAQRRSVSNTVFSNRKPCPAVGHRLLRSFLPIVFVLFQACSVIDRPPPPREALDALWEQAMLAGRSVHSVHNIEVPWPTKMPDRIVPSTWGARSTSHAIVVEEPPSIWRRGWLLQGGLLGREELAEGTVEFFGKGNVRLHWPYDSKLGQDHSWDFFLVVRSKKSRGAKVIRRWHFNPEEVVLAGRYRREPDPTRGATHFLHVSPDEIREDPGWAQGYPRLEFGPFNNASSGHLSAGVSVYIEIYP